jgi:hypothetical protein
VEDARVQAQRLHGRTGDGPRGALLCSENVHRRVVVESCSALARCARRWTSHGHVMPALVRERRTAWAPCRSQVRANKLQPRAWLKSPGTENAQMGGAEGTRTPDPQTPRSAEKGPRMSAPVRFRRSEEGDAVSEPLWTAASAVRWPPSWHHLRAA